MPANHVTKIQRSLRSQVEIDKRVRTLVSEKKSLKDAFSEHDDTIATRIAKDVYSMKIEKMTTLGKRPSEYREEFMEWGAEAGIGGEKAMYKYVAIGELFHNVAHARVLESKPLSFRALEAISLKGFTDAEVGAFGQFLITEDKPISSSAIHNWAHETFGKAKPTKKTKEDENEYRLREDYTTMEARLAKADPPMEGRALLGMGYGSCQDVFKVVSRYFTQQYHPDKGGDPVDYERIRLAIEHVADINEVEG